MEQQIQMPYSKFQISKLGKLCFLSDSGSNLRSLAIALAKLGLSDGRAFRRSNYEYSANKFLRRVHAVVCGPSSIWLTIKASKTVASKIRSIQNRSIQSS